jgi:hypothetical protein
MQALEFACGNGKTDIAELLIARGASIEAPLNGPQVRAHGAWTQVLAQSWLSLGSVLAQARLQSECRVCYARSPSVSFGGAGWLSHTEWLLYRVTS